MSRRPGTCSPKRLIQHTDPILDICASFYSCVDSMYACLVTLVLQYILANRLFSLRLLGIFFTEYRGRFRPRHCSIQGAWRSRFFCSVELTRCTQALLVGQLLWIAAVTLIRASVIFLYIYIFCIKGFRLACYGVLTINLAYFTATVLACCLICRPFAFNWDQSLHGACGDQKSLDLFIGVFNLLMDIVTVALPMPVLWGLQMPVGRKVAISGLFSLGIT